MFKKKFLQILQSLGFVDKAKQNSLTDEDWKQIDAAFEKQHGKPMAELMAENSNNEALAQEREAALSLLNATNETKTEETEESEDSNNDGAAAPVEATTETVSIVEGITAIQTELAASKKETQAMKAQVEKMAAQAKPDTPMRIVSRKLKATGPGHTATHLFGIEHNMFSMQDRWNKIASNPNEAKLSNPSKEDFDKFQVDSFNFGRGLSSRYKFLKENNKLDALKNNQSFENDHTELGDAGLGDQYVVLRQDALIARIVQIPTVTNLFKVRSGVQDRELMTAAYFKELSQAYQPGHVFKGGVKLQPEMAYVDDAMFKVQFGPMKEIERQYIGYLNTDGSDPMKWSMIEWQLLNMYQVLTGEQDDRRINGCFVEPETGVAGFARNAGTGLIHTLLRYEYELKMLAHSDKAYNTYTQPTFVDGAFAFLEDVEKVLGKGEKLTDRELYLNERHKSWWKKGIRTKFGKDIDFTGPDSYANKVPDVDVRINWVPNMGDSTLMFMQKPGNLMCVENEPGEMLNVDFDKSMEQVHVWSTWKEGFTAFLVGRRFSTLAELKANNYFQQEIFVNDPATLLAADATTADGSKNFRFRTINNSAATTFTEFINPEGGVVYVIECGGVTNATKTAKSGKFKNIAAWTPTAIGDYLKVAIDSEGNYIELERRVAGARTINTIAQPNIVGGR